MKQFLFGFYLLALAGGVSAVSGVTGSALLGWLALGLGVYGTGCAFVGMRAMFNGR